jgi:hypothetical protein
MRLSSLKRHDAAGRISRIEEKDVIGLGHGGSQVFDAQHAVSAAEGWVKVETIVDGAQHADAVFTDERSTLSP